MVAYRDGSGGLSSDGDLGRIATEGGDVVAHPSQSGLLVGESVVAAVSVSGLECGVSEETQGSQPVIDGDDDDIAAAGQPGGLVDVGTAVEKAAAVDPHHDRPGRVRGGPVRRPHRQIQAVLAGLPAVVGVHPGVLNAARSGFGGVAHRGPRHRRDRRLPAQWTDRGRRIGDALKDPHTGAGAAAHRSGFGGDHRWVGDRGGPATAAREENYHQQCRRVPDCGANGTGWHVGKPYAARRGPAQGRNWPLTLAPRGISTTLET